MVKAIFPVDESVRIGISMLKNLCVLIFFVEIDDVIVFIVVQNPYSVNFRIF